MQADRPNVYHSGDGNREPNESDANDTGVGMKDTLKKPVIRTPLDRADGGLGPKRLAIVIAVLLVVGGLTIFAGQRYLTSIDTWEATVTGVAQGTINFAIEEGSDDVDIASFPEGMAIEVGDKVLIKTDVNTGNRVVKVLDR